jgi:hypothetical protein
MKERSLLLAASALFALVPARAADEPLRIGMIGLDTSHVTAFTGILNDSAHKKHQPGARVVVGFPGGSPDIESSRTRVKGFTEDLKTKWGVRIVDTVAEVVANCDAIMIESVDGRAHLPFAREVFGKGKPVFIDKPLGGNLREVLEIAALAEKTNTPLGPPRTQDRQARPHARRHLLRPLFPRTAPHRSLLVWRARR